MKAVCPLCSARKAKRACPGVNREICPVCCGTKRLTEIRCPPDCPYLATSRVHPPAVVQRQQQRDLEFLLPRISDLTETQYRLFLLVQALTLQHAREAIPAPHDQDVADAAASVAATLETARKGIIYEHQPASLPAQRLAVEMSGTAADVVKRAGSDGSRFERDMAIALRSLERTAREVRAEIPDEESPSTSWTALATRLMGTLGRQTTDQKAEDGAKDQPRIIL